MDARPMGTVTFLFTDIEGSTRQWEADPEAMRSALAAHDEVLRSAVEGHGGWLFKHTGDGVCASFSSARGAVEAASEAQRALGLPVRMGMATGEAEQRGDDYFGPALNRAARVMGVAHGGQILVSNSTAALLGGVDLFDLGERRLRDLSGTEHLFQVLAEGLRVEFPPLRTLDAVPGNLPVQSTSFVGRDTEVKELAELMRAHRLVTLTGVGGVGKTRLAVQVAAELAGEFGDGVWLVELAPVGDPTAVADVVASVLGVTPQAGRNVTDSVADALKGRTLLLVLDNCEHLLDAAADVVETILARAESVTVIATSREGLRVGAEHLWAVPSLDVGAGATSAAVELFVERAEAVVAGFVLASEADEAAVVEICGRLDGIALAIELAAARMVSMSPTEVRDRLDDRFRLLSGGRRGVDRHQTLRNTVAWSYDLLADDERDVLGRCSVFADGFDLTAATHICGGEQVLDEYAVLDLLDSLVRKSLIVAEQVSGRTRYGMLETIRQFAVDQLTATGASSAVRNRHATYFAEQATEYWVRWDGPDQRVSLDWVDAEFANLRAGFRWASDEADVVTATAIAAHTTMLAWALQRFESVGWAEQLLESATDADLSQLPRLYTAASLCVFINRPETALAYAQTAIELGAASGYDPFAPLFARFMEAHANLFMSQMDRWLEICAHLAGQGGVSRVAGLTGVVFFAPVDEAMALAEETLDSARSYGNPFFVAAALAAYGRAFTPTDPGRALGAFREGRRFSDEHGLRYFRAIIARDSAELEAMDGELDLALELFDTAVDLCHLAGDYKSVGSVLGYLAAFFDRLERPELGAIAYGVCVHSDMTSWVNNLPDVVEHLRTQLGESAFDELVAKGSAMDTTQAVEFARQEIRAARLRLPA